MKVLTGYQLIIEAIKKILNALSLRDELLFVLVINTGLRISDILSLKIAHVLANKGVLDRIELKGKRLKTKEQLSSTRKHV